MMDQSPTFSTSADLAYYADKYDSMGFHIAEKVIDKVNNKYGFQIKFWSSFNVEIFCFFIYVLYFRQMKQMAKNIEDLENMKEVNLVAYKFYELTRKNHFEQLKNKKDGLGLNAGIGTSSGMTKQETEEIERQIKEFKKFQKQ